MFSRSLDRVIRPFDLLKGLWRREEKLLSQQVVVVIVNVYVSVVG